MEADKKRVDTVTESLKRVQQRAQGKLSIQPSKSEETQHQDSLSNHRRDRRNTIGPTNSDTPQMKKSISEKKRENMKKRSITNHEMALQKREAAK